MNVEDFKTKTTDALKKYWIDLVERARAWKIDPVIWREEEIRRAIQILSRRTKNNPVLIWEPGVWKTAIVEWIAKKIAEKDVPDNLLEKTIINLDMWALLAWAMFKWEFEERFKAVINEVEKSAWRIILFIDELHTIVWAGNLEWQNDAWNLLKPSLARGELHLIWATTINEYRKYIEKDAALERRFATIVVDEPNRSDALAILRWIKDKYETHHWLKITDSAIESAVDLAIKYISDRKLPDKAIDLMDEAMSSVKLKSISKPVELDVLEKEIRTMKIELEAKRWEEKEKKKPHPTSPYKGKEKDQIFPIDKGELEGVLKSLEENIKIKESESKVVEEAWRKEKDILTNIKESREKIDKLKQEAVVYEREWNLWEVARIRYGEIPELEKKIEENEAKMKELQDSGTSYLKERVESNDIAEVVAKWTWIPAQRLLESEKEKLLKLEETLKTQVIGQSIAIEAISNAIRRARAWLAEEWKPVWSFLFLWPTWVWKTETAKALARELFNDEKNMIRIDMSEYMEKHSVSRLVWAPPGYIWYEEWGQLTEAVRRKPYSVLLFDEIEKAHGDVFNILLQVLDDGRLTDGKGRVVNFSNTIIILTSNIAGQKIQNMIEKWKEIYEIYVSVEEDLRKYFKPEFLNRLDDIIIFNSLKESDILKIVDIVLADFLNLLASKKIVAEVSLTLKTYLANTWYDKDFGARPLKRLITKKLINPLSSMIISGKLTSWDKIEIDLGKNKEVEVKKIS